MNIFPTFGKVPSAWKSATTRILEIRLSTPTEEAHSTIAFSFAQNKCIPTMPNGSTGYSADLNEIKR